MPIRFRCDACRARLKASGKLAGRETRCLQCGASVLVPPLPAGDPPRTWYYAAGTEVRGPFAFEDLARLARAGTLRRDTPVHSEAGDWAPAAETALAPHLPDPRPTASEVATAVRAAAARLGAEVRAAAAVTAGFVRRTAARAIARAAGYRLGRRLAAEKRALGEAAAAAGLGDERLLARAAALREEIENLRAAAAPTARAEAERRGVLVRLADAVADLPDLPPALAAHRGRVRTAEAERRTAGRTPGGERLLPAGSANRLRLAAGLGLPLAALYVLMGAIVRAPAVVGSAADEDRVKAAVGLVVCGVVRTELDGSTVEMPLGSGTGFAVTADGTFLTNRHVVEGVQRLRAELSGAGLSPSRRRVDLSPAVWVFVDGRRHAAEIVHLSDRYDLAILRVAGPFPRVFALGGDGRVPRGTAVSALGFPEAAGIALSERERAGQLTRIGIAHKRVEDAFAPRDFAFALTAGHVSRAIEAEGVGWVQHDCAVHGGNSGGPLVAADGVVVGINTSRHRTADGVSFALGLPQLRPEIERFASGSVWR